MMDVCLEEENMNKKKNKTMKPPTIRSNINNNDYIIKYIQIPYVDRYIIVIAIDSFGNKYEIIRIPWYFFEKSSELQSGIAELMSNKQWYNFCIKTTQYNKYLDEINQ